jgi:hypothetical protein
MYYERLLKLANSLQTPTINNFDHSVPIKITFLFMHCHYGNDTKYFATTQNIDVNL